jgi:hypothetical protein
MSMLLSGSYQTVVHLVVVKQTPGSCQAVIRLPLGSCQVVIRLSFIAQPMALKDFSVLFCKDFDGFNFMLRTRLTDAIQLSIEIPKKIKIPIFS